MLFVNAFQNKFHNLIIFFILVNPSSLLKLIQLTFFCVFSAVQYYTSLFLFPLTILCGHEHPPVHQGVQSPTEYGENVPLLDPLPHLPLL